MFSFFKKAFGKETLIDLAKAKKYEEFYTCLHNGKFFVIDSDIGEGIKLGSNQSEILKYIEDEAKRNSARSEHKFFSYNYNDKSYFPFFLSENHAANFAAAYSGLEKKIFAMQMLEVDGRLILPYIAASENVIINDQDDYECKVENELIQFLKSKAQAQDKTT